MTRAHRKGLKRLYAAMRRVDPEEAGGRALHAEILNAAKGNRRGYSWYRSPTFIRAAVVCVGESRLRRRSGNLQVIP